MRSELTPTALCVLSQNTTIPPPPQPVEIYVLCVTRDHNRGTWQKIRLPSRSSIGQIQKCPGL